jgi:hypothetical protein
VDWIYLAQDGYYWRDIVKTAVDLRVANDVKEMMLIIVWFGCLNIISKCCLLFKLLTVVHNR